MNELEKLKRKYKKLKWKEEEAAEKKRLKQEIWRMEHKGLCKVSGVIEKAGSGIVNMVKWSGKKISKAAENYEKKVNSPQHQTKQMSVEDMMEVMP